MVGERGYTSTLFKILAQVMMCFLVSLCALPPCSRIVKLLVIHLHGERLGFWNPWTLWGAFIYGGHASKF